MDLIAKGVVAIDLDDIIIFTRTLAKHHKVVREVLQRLQDNDLYLRLEKCEFNQSKVEYLGMIISEGSVAKDEGKVS